MQSTPLAGKAGSSSGDIWALERTPHGHEKRAPQHMESGMSVLCYVLMAALCIAERLLRSARRRWAPLCRS